MCTLNSIRIHHNSYVIIIMSIVMKGLAAQKASAAPAKPAPVASRRNVSATRSFA